MSDDLDDDAFVERIRGRLAVPAWPRRFLIGANLLAVVTFPVLMILWCRLAVNAPWPGMGMGFGLGVAAGTTVGFTWMTALYTLFTHLFDRGRHLRLLVKFHDEAEALRRTLLTADGT